MAVQSIPDASASKPATIPEAVLEIVNGTCCELAYIGELAQTLYESASDDDPNQIEALAHSIILMRDSLQKRLDQYLHQWGEANNGSVLIESNPPSISAHASRQDTPATDQPASASEEGDWQGLRLNSDDFLHLWALLETAADALPASTDDDSTRASLRAARDFLNAHS